MRERQINADESDDTYLSILSNSLNGHTFHLIIVVRGIFPEFLHAAERDPLFLLVLSVECVFFFTLGMFVERVCGGGGQGGPSGKNCGHSRCI